MTISDKDRVFIFRRIISEDYSPAHLKGLDDLKDEELLDIMQRHYQMFYQRTLLNFLYFLILFYMIGIRVKIRL